MQRAIKAIKKARPELVVIADSCFCEYTDHGHCGVLHEGQLDNDASLENLARTVLSYARAGVDIVAPSGMLDGFVTACRESLDEEGFDVLPPHVGNPARPPAPRLGEERLELLDRLGVDHDRRRRLVLGPQMTGERGEVVQNIRFGYRVRPSPTAGARAHNYRPPCFEPRSQLWAQKRLWSSSAPVMSCN